MWQLDRILLRAVGHPDARFAPLDVDLTNDKVDSEIGVGVPVDTVLWMENGTGKTTLLSLALSVLRPRRTEFLSKDRDLADYVLGGDVAHVVLVFSREVPGHLFDERERLVVGQSMAWRHGRNSGRTEDLQRAHWGFRATEGLDVEALPFVREDGRPRTLIQFGEELRRLMQANLQGEPFLPDSNQTRWEEWLVARQLDTEIFRQQIDINADEGHISEAFNFASGDEFVRWVLERTTTGDGLALLASDVGDLHDLLDSREPLKHEARLCEQLAASLDEMHQAHTLIEEAEAGLAEAYGDASLLAAQLDAAQQQSVEQAEAHSEQAEQADAGAKGAARRQRGLQRQAVTARRRAVELRLRAARKQAEKVAEALAQAAVRRDAWRAVDDVLEQQELDGQHELLVAQLDELDDRLRPLRERLGVVQRRFAVRAQQLLDEADEAGRALQERIDATAEEREACTRRAAGARKDAAAAREKAATAAAKLEELDRQLALAVADGLVGEGQDLGIALEEAREGAARARQQREETERDKVAAKQDVARTRAAESAASQALAEATGRRDRAADQVATMETAASEVAANPEVRSVADSDDVDPFAVGGVLLERLRDAAASARRAAVEERVANAETRRLDQGIEQTSLAPSRLDLEHAAARLRDADIGAHTGWAYLADAVDPRLHGALSTARPDIADGIVVDDEAARDAALQLLAELEPWAPIRVSTKGEVDQAAGHQASEHVIAAHQALHDRDAAAQLRAELAEVLTGARDAEATVDQRARVLADAASAVERLLAAHPDPDAVQAQLQQSEEALEQAEEALEQATEDRAAAEEALEQALEDVVEAERAATLAAQRVQRIQQLHDEQEGRAALAEQRTTCLREATELERAAAGDESRLVELADERERLVVQRNDAVNRTDKIAERCTRLGIVLDEAAGEEVAEEVTEPLDALEGELTSIEAQLRREHDDSGLHERLAAVERSRAELVAELQLLDEAVLELARQLAASADAADAAQRRRSTSQAEQTRDELSNREGELRERIKGLEKVLEELAAQEGRPIDLDDLDADACESLASGLVERGALEAARASELAKTAQQRTELAQKAETRATEIGQASKNLRAHGEAIADVPAASPWAGEDPHQAVRSIDARLKKVQGELTQARELRNEQHVIVQGVVNDPVNLRFGEEDEAAAPIVAEMRRLSPTRLGAVAGRYHNEMLSRRDRIEEKLGEIDRHREALAKTLLHHTESALRTLHTVGLRSRMPDGLGEWSGRQFLSINHDDPPSDDKAMADRMKRVIDDIVARGSSPDATALQFEAVRAAVGGDGFRVRIIKPHEELRHDPVDVTELNSFSGGQRLTAAVALFLTLMNMRNQARGSNSRGASVLLLDNPFGKSSADTFVHVQRKLAERLGVQLVYTTAVKDLGALSQFRKTIRFAKKRHTGTGSLHVVEDESSVLRSVAMDRLRDAVSGEGVA